MSSKLCPYSIINSLISREEAMPVHEYEGISSNESFESHRGISGTDSEVDCQEPMPGRPRRFFSALAGLFSWLLEDDSPVDSHYPRRPT